MIKITLTTSSDIRVARACGVKGLSFRQFADLHCEGDLEIALDSLRSAVDCGQIVWSDRARVYVAA